MLKQGCKLLNVNGFQLIFEKLNQLSNHNQEAIAYLSHYQRIYQNIENISDLITFLNWYATDEITKQLEILYRWLLTHPELDSNIYGTLNAPHILNIRQFMLKSINVDIRTRIGLFNPQQVHAICEHLSVYKASNKN